MKSKVIVFALTITMIFLLGGCGNSEKLPPFSENTMIMMGTPITIRIYAENGEDLIKEAFEKVRAIEEKMSTTLENSEVSNINNNSGKSFVKVSQETFEVIKKGKLYSELSGGRFDISIGPLVNLWGIGSKAARLPSNTEIKSALSLVDYRNILLDEANQSVMLKNEGMAIDLGGIAKGYTADVIADILRKEGVQHAIINLGGNVMLIGEHPAGRPWSIGLQDPFNSEVRGESQVGLLQLSDKTIVTSGVYERYFEQDGKRYHHILSPSTGYPVDNDLVSVSILTDVSADADALSTSVFSMGLEEGLKFVEGMDGVDAIFITGDRKVYMTSGVKNIFKIKNTSFMLQD